MGLEEVFGLPHHLFDHYYFNAYITVSSRGLVSHYIFYTEIVYVPIVCDHTYISYHTCRKTFHFFHKQILLLPEIILKTLLKELLLPPVMESRDLALLAGHLP